MLTWEEEVVDKVVGEAIQAFSKPILLFCGPRREIGKEI